MINLLPPSEKRKRLEENRLKLVWTLGILFLGFLICFGLVLILVKSYISKQIEVQDSLVRAEQGKTLYFQKIETDINDVNETLTQFNLFYNQHFDLPAFLRKIDNLFLTGVHLDNFSYQEEDSRISFSGKADSIGRVYELREELKKDESFQNIKLIIPDWSQSKEVGFQVSFTIK